MNSKGFSPIKPGQSKTIRYSVITGFNDDTGRCIEGADKDLCNMGIYLASKPVQELVTDSNIAFLGVPINTETCMVKNIVDKTLKALRQRLD